jgi:hypothetical protein
MAPDADSKLMISWAVGKRDANYANGFMQNVAERLATRVQLTTDGHGRCLQAVEGASGIDVDYGQLIKAYGPSPEPGLVFSEAVSGAGQTETLISRPRHAALRGRYATEKFTHPGMLN